MSRFSSWWPRELADVQGTLKLTAASGVSIGQDRTTGDAPLRVRDRSGRFVEIRYSAELFVGLAIGVLGLDRTRRS